MDSSAKIDAYIQKHKQWEAVLETLRELMCSLNMEETVKWGAPTYTVDGKNIAGIGAFKNYAGIWFFNGALLNDPKKVLINAQEGKTIAMRQWRFTSVKEIDKDLVCSYLTEAIQNQKEGKEIKPVKTTRELTLPEILDKALKEDMALNNAFKNFPPYKQKEFTEYIIEAKRQATKIDRLEKIKPLLLKGIGLNDKYRK